MPRRVKSPCRVSISVALLKRQIDVFLCYAGLTLAGCGIRVGLGGGGVGAGAIFSFSASLKTCRIFSTKTNLISLNGSFGTSSKSRRFRARSEERRVGK